MFPTLGIKTVKLLRSVSLLSTIIFCVAGCTSTSTENSTNNQNTNKNANTNSNANTNTNKNSNTASSEETEIYTETFQLLVATSPPPTTDGGGGDSSRSVEKIQKDLGITSLSQTVILLVPERYPITLESLEFAILSEGKRVFSTQVRSTRNLTTFPPLERQNSSITGYTLELDPQTIAEGDRYFVKGNVVVLEPKIKFENPVNATFYLADRNSRVEKGKRAQ